MKNKAIINIIGSVDEHLVRNFLMELEKKQHAAHTDFFISSPGGYVDSAVEIAKYMLCMPGTFSTIAGRFVASSAFFLHQCCPGKRIAYSDSIFLLHRQFKDNASLQIDQREREREKTMFEIISDFTGQNFNDIMALAEKNIFLTAYEARDYGFVTDIIASPAPRQGIFFDLFMLKCAHDHPHPVRERRPPGAEQAGGPCRACGRQAPGTKRRGLGARALS